MTYDLAFTLIVTALTVVLFVSERFAAGLVAMVAAGALMAGGVLTPEQGFAGFSNSATVTVGAMFVLSAAVYRSGAVDVVGKLLGWFLRRSLPVAIAGVGLIVAVLSAFINNTAVVAVFLPVAIGVAQKAERSPSKVLIPLSFASMLGGVCTLLGTSTNLIVSGVAVDAGLPAIGMFEMAPLGIVLLVVGLVYLSLGGYRMLPARRTGDSVASDIGASNYIADVVLEPSSPSIGSTALDAPLTRDFNCDVLAVLAGGVKGVRAHKSHRLEAGDVLRLRCDLDDLTRLMRRDAVRVGPEDIADVELRLADAVLVEAVVAPGSALEGHRWRQVALADEKGVHALAVRQRGETHTDWDEVRLRAGDAIVMLVDSDRLDALRRDNDFLLATELDATSTPAWSPIAALSILAAVVLSATAGLVPIAASATLGSVAMIVCGCLSTDEAVDAIDWNVIFLLGGLLALGAGLQASGGVAMFAEWLVNIAGRGGPTAVVAAVYAMSVLLSAVLSNNATAALLAPIAIASADIVGVDSRAMLLAVAFGASTSFMTPVGYQTNTLVYGAGHYTFGDFVKVGGPLTLVIGAITVALLPLFYPM